MNANEKNIEWKLGKRRNGRMGLEIYLMKVLIDCPLLSETKFVEKHPDIEYVAAFIYEIRTIMNRTNSGEAIPFFEENGIKDLNEYLNLINSWFDKGARAHYKAIKEMLERI